MTTSPLKQAVATVLFLALVLMWVDARAHSVWVPAGQLPGGGEAFGPPKVNWAPVIEHMAFFALGALAALAPFATQAVTARLQRRRRRDRHRRRRSSGSSSSSAGTSSKSVSEE